MFVRRDLPPEVEIAVLRWAVRETVRPRIGAAQRLRSEREWYRRTEKNLDVVAKDLFELIDELYPKTPRDGSDSAKAVASGKMLASVNAEMLASHKVDTRKAFDEAIGNMGRVRAEVMSAAESLIRRIKEALALHPWKEETSSCGLRAKNQQLVTIVAQLVQDGWSERSAAYTIARDIAEDCEPFRKIGFTQGRDFSGRANTKRLAEIIRVSYLASVRKKRQR